MATQRTAPTFIAGRAVNLMELPAHLADHPSVQVANSTLRQLGDFVQHHTDVMQDPLLSERGKAAKLNPLKVGMARVIAAAAAVNQDAAKQTDKREAAMLAVPAIAPSDAASAAVDVEVRQWWRSLDSKQRADMLQKFQDGPEHQRIEAALLRSPVALADPELLAIRDSWNRQARIDNAGEATAIARDRYAQDYAGDAIKQAAAIFQASTAMPHGDLLRAVVTGDNPMANGAAVFGFSQDAIDRAKVLADGNESVDG